MILGRVLLHNVLPHLLGPSDLDLGHERGDSKAFHTVFAMVCSPRRPGKGRNQAKMSVQGATDGRLSTKGRAARRALLVIPLVLKNIRMPMTYNT